MLNIIYRPRFQIYFTILFLILSPDPRNRAGGSFDLENSYFGMKWYQQGRSQLSQIFKVASILNRSNDPPPPRFKSLGLWNKALCIACIYCFHIIFVYASVSQLFFKQVREKKSETKAKSQPFIKR